MSRTWMCNCWAVSCLNSSSFTLTIFHTHVLWAPSYLTTWSWEPTAIWYAAMWRSPGWEDLRHLWPGKRNPWLDSVAPADIMAVTLCMADVTAVTFVNGWCHGCNLLRVADVMTITFESCWCQSCNLCEISEPEHWNKLLPERQCFNLCKQQMFVVLNF